MDRLNDKVALVTGAARGIGEAVARAYIREGARVWLTDIEANAGQALAAEIGERATFSRLDVREEEDWLRATSDILAASGKLDIVVNNAGITGFEAGPVAHDPENASLADWRAVHRTNLDGVFLGCKLRFAQCANQKRDRSSISLLALVCVGIPARPPTRRPRLPCAITPKPLRFGARNRGSPFAATRYIPRQ